jgi:signal peptidase II
VDQSSETQSAQTTLAQWALLFGTAGLLLLLDQLTKAWVVANFTLYERQVPIPFLADVFNFTYTQNTGAAFGLFSSASNTFLVIACIATGVIIYYYRKIEGRALLLRLAMGFQMGGALGNAIDRVTRGFVVDFLHVFYEPLGFDYPIFNVADAAIVIGVLTLVIILWRTEEKKPEAPPAPSDQPESV